MNITQSKTIIKSDMTTSKDYVLLCNQKGEVFDRYDKILAHKEGLLHLAISIFIFNKKGELLLQKRSSDKYHSGGKWTNTCCTHPVLGEKIIETAYRRLNEEMGVETKLHSVFRFVYKAEVENGMIEHEHDVVFVGDYDGEVNPNPDEAEEYKWISLKRLTQDLKKNPSHYTSWFKIIIGKYSHKLN